jgi:DNA-binding transcriptional regulator LsrR (DeoR family)
MAAKQTAGAHQDAFQLLIEVRNQALHHTRMARELAAERREIIQGLIDEGLTQAEIGRELGVTRQAIQKMLAC